MSSIRPSGLSLSDVPAADAELHEIIEFANSCNGYELAGSFEDCSSIAKSPDPNSVEELWIAMYFHFRAIRHGGDPVNVHSEAFFRGLVVQIRSLLRAGKNSSQGSGQRSEKEREMADTPKQKETFGGCNFGKLSPKAEDLGPGTKILNVTLGFEDALKLNLAISECVRRLNSYDRSTSAGRKASLTVAVHLDKGRVTINEGKL